MMTPCDCPPPHEQHRRDVDPRPDSAPDSDDYEIVAVPRSNPKGLQYPPPQQKGVNMWHQNAASGASFSKNSDEVPSHFNKTSLASRPGAFAVQLTTPRRSSPPYLSHHHALSSYNGNHNSGGERPYLTIPTYPSAAAASSSSSSSQDNDQEVGTWETSFWTTAELVDEDELRRQVLADTPAVHATLWKGNDGDDVEVSFLMAYRAKQQRAQRRWFALTATCCVGLVVLVVVLVARGNHFVVATSSSSTTTTQANNGDYGTATTATTNP